VRRNKQSRNRKIAKRASDCVAGFVFIIVNALFVFKLMQRATCLPFWTRTYCCGYGIYVFILISSVRSLPWDTITVFFAVSLSYTIPQFFIVRWLAKETKDATMTMEWNGTTNVD